MLSSRQMRHLLLGAAIFSGAANAVGLGEISLHSHIGEALRADVQLFASGESLDPACFSLGPVPNAELPVITAARMRLVRIGPDYRLIISGSKAIDEPAIVISLRAGCGMDLQREYVLLPAPPPANSDIELPEKAAIPIPREVSRSRVKAEDSILQEQPTAMPRNTQRVAKKPKPPLPRDTLAGIADGKDRIVLGAALDNLPPTSAGEPLAPVSALDERILKMETTLHLLDQEVDKLNTAVSLAVESRAMRAKLQEMQQANPGFLPGVRAATPQAPALADAGPKPRHDGWLELLLGVLLGGSVSAGVAHLVSRKQLNTRPLGAPPPRIAKPRQTHHSTAA